MRLFTWQQWSLQKQIRWLKFVLPPLLALIVIFYQLGIAQALEQVYGHGVHYGVEIAFYSLTGPIVTWLTLVWVERSLATKEALEQQVRRQTEQLANLTAVSADAIISLDENNQIQSWNRGAERMIGCPAKIMIGKPIHQLLPEAPALQQQQLVQDFETTAQTAYGRFLTVNLTQTQQADSTLIIMRDVTARRERETILEEERARIARDLHDGVAQTLYFLALKADMLRQQVDPAANQIVAELKEIGQQARSVIREVRRTIFALRPLDWTTLGFWPALAQFVAGFAEQAGWQSECQLDETIAVPPSLEPTVFRLVQESLNNVAKHAEATQVWITAVCPNHNTLTLTIRDNGRGFANEDSQHGLGLAQMQTRVERANGRWQLHSQPDSGTTITVQLPLLGETHDR